MWRDIGLFGSFRAVGRIRPGIEQAVCGVYAGAMRGVYIDEASLRTWTNIEAVFKQKKG